MNLIRETAMIPLRKIDKNKLQTINPEDLEAITLNDFKKALKSIKPTVNKTLIKNLEKFNKEFGC